MGNKFVPVIIAFILLSFIGVGVYFFVIKNTIDISPEEEPKIEVLLSSIDVNSGQGIDTNVVIEESKGIGCGENINNTCVIPIEPKSLKLSKTTSTSVMLPQNKMYNIYYLYPGYYTSRKILLLGGSQAGSVKTEPVPMYPFSSEVQIIPRNNFREGINDMDFSIIASDGWIRRTMLCIAWSPAFIYVNFPSQEIKCSNMWEYISENRYSCDSETLQNIKCSNLKDGNYTCIIDKVLPPQRLFNKVDICTNFEQTISKGEDLNFTLNYKLSSNPKETDYLRFYLIDRDKIKDNGWDFAIENLNGGDIARPDDNIEIMVMENWGDVNGNVS